TNITYDQRNRPYQVKDVAQHTTSCMYDDYGRKASITRANGQQITFDQYDALNRVRQQTVTQVPGTPAVTHYDYDPTGGRLQTFTDPNGNVYTYAYDQLNRKTQLTYPGGSSESWTYDEPRGLLHLYTNRNTKTKTFTYDALSRMKTASWNDNGTTPMVTYTYDPKGRTLTINNVNANITLDYYRSEE